MDEVTIGILAALPVEGAAMARLIDDLQPFEMESDPNLYRVGSMPSKNPNHPHRVALAVLPKEGTRFAAMMCANLLRTFTQVRCVLMMGIAGGIPRPEVPARHVRLGDVVVASLGIVDYGSGRQIDGVRRLRRSDGQISGWLLRAARELQFKESNRDWPWERWLDPEQADHARDYPRPGEETDRLFVRGSQQPHPDRSESGHPVAAPKIHYGSIASSDVLMRDEVKRDELATEFDDLLAMEMEGSGIAATTAAHDVPWFMVRGVADYCENTGKNDLWHAHASYAAAAYIRALLAECRPHPRVLPLVDPSEDGRIVALLSRLPMLDLRSVCEAACPHLPEIPSDVLAKPERAFRYLSLLNADADGLPPALTFVDELATKTSDGILAAELHHWVDVCATRMRAEKALQLRRTQATQADQEEKANPCLLIEIARDGINHERYRIASWIQERTGPWRPRPGPGEANNLALGDAEVFVASLVDQAEEESDWQTTTDPVTIEFLLPTGMLNLPVEWWRTNSMNDEHPLCVDYEVVVRSLDRMINRKRRRMWVTRWSALLAEPGTTRAQWGENPRNEDALKAWGTRLRADGDVAMVVLSGPPARSPGREELDMALRAGVPVILWDREDNDTTEVIRDLIRGDPSTLPARAKALRAKAAAAPLEEQLQHAGRLVVLLWDDPDRLIDVGRDE
jgi:nucleoside phosphorylase